MITQKRIIDVFAENYKMLSKLAIMTVKNKDASLDVMQNVALILLKKENQLNDIDNVIGFLATCVRRAALNFLRDESRAYSTDPIKFEEMLSNVQSSIATDYIEWVMMLKKHLVSYSPKLQSVFIKYYVDGYPLTVLAEELGMTPNALAQQFKRMRGKIASQSPKYNILIMILSFLHTGY